jgi:antibiotic biosynthesis monooxygenase (ABM) superfamily enzyme
MRLDQHTFDKSSDRIARRGTDPGVTQFETRDRLVFDELRLRQERRLAVSTESSESARPRRGGPPRYKLALLTWGGAYTVITVILAVLGPRMASWPLGLRTLVLSVLMVVALTWLVMPGLTRLFRVWLTRPTT